MPAAPISGSPSPREIEAVVAALRRGRLALLPTETFYALSADPRREDAVARLFAAKRRDRAQPVPLVAADAGQVAAIAPGFDEDPAVAALCTAFWPGPLSLVVEPAGVAFPAGVTAPDGTVAIRCTSHPVAAAVARALRFAVVATSANRSGAPPPVTLAAARRALGKDAPAAALDGGRTAGGAPSTIVDLRGGGPRIVREGAIAVERLLAVLRSVGSGR